MSNASQKTRGWKNIGTSQTSPVANTLRTNIELDHFYLVIGFEVNNAKAFKNNTHDLAVDYGHAFYYLVQNLKIIQSFSFGPHGRGKIGWLDKGYSKGKSIYTVGAIMKNGSKNARPGTADFPITESVKTFKILVDTKQAEALNKKTTEARYEIYEGKLNYSALVNDTCAETAKELLDDAGIITPSGASWIKHSELADLPIAHAVNPYKWHQDFRGKYEEVVFQTDEVNAWIPRIGEDDPIYGVPLFAKADPMFGVGL